MEVDGGKGGSETLVFIEKEGTNGRLLVTEFLNCSW